MIYTIVPIPQKEIVLEDLSAWLFTEWSEFRDLGSIAIFSIILFAAVAIGLIFAIRRSTTLSKQYKFAETGLNIDRFQKATHMLSENDVLTRQAGISILSELMRQFPNDFATPVRQILSSFIEHNPDSSTNALRKQKRINPTKGGHDYLAAFKTLCALNAMEHKTTDAEPIECRNLQLPFFDLSQQNMSNMQISNSNLRGSIFFNAKISQSVIGWSNFSHCSLRDTDLSGSIFSKVDFEHTIFDDADCRGTIFQDCKNLTFEQLSKAQNVDANLLNELNPETVEESNIVEPSWEDEITVEVPPQKSVNQLI